MPHFVTRIVLSRRVPLWPPARIASVDVDGREAHEYRRRLAGLRTPAPDTLRARVQRELRAAEAATTARSE